MLALTACWSKPQAAQNTQAYDPGLPGPATQLGEHQTPAFTEVNAYLRMVQTALAAATVDGQIPADQTVACTDPRLGVSALPKRNSVVSCQIRMSESLESRVAAKFSNNWLIVSDPQGVRRVSESDFAAFVQGM